MLFCVLCIVGTTKYEPALSGFVILVSCVLFYTFNINKKVFFISLFVIGIVVVSTYILLPKDYLPIFLRDNSRMVIWKEWFPILKGNFILGVGLGSINLIVPTTAIKNAYHMHLEFYHYLIELGIIGGILIVNIVLDFFKTRNNDVLVFKTIVVGFLVSCFFTYPTHLWMPTMFGAFSYAVVKGQDGRFYEKTNS